MACSDTHHQSGRWVIAVHGYRLENLLRLVDPIHLPLAPNVILELREGERCAVGYFAAV